MQLTDTAPTRTMAPTTIKIFHDPENNYSSDSPSSLSIARAS